MLKHRRANELDAYPFLSKEVALLGRRLIRVLPTLGICLESQLMAKALGARVYPGAAKEIGWGNVALTREGSASSLSPLVDEDALVLDWHGDTFGLPTEAIRLASSAIYDNQSFSSGQRRLALRFHLDANSRRLEE